MFSPGNGPGSPAASDHFPEHTAPARVIPVKTKPRRDEKAEAMEWIGALRNQKVKDLFHDKRFIMKYFRTNEQNSTGSGTNRRSFLRMQAAATPGRGWGSFIDTINLLSA